MFPHRTISIHALREEGDAAGVYYADAQWNFYPRPPRGGRHALDPLRRPANQISIHALREEGDADGAVDPLSTDISIHALREEGDSESVRLLVQGVQFLSTPSARRATFTVTGIYVMSDGISIHALREEGDQRAHHARVRGRDFYPRPPRGGRRDSPAHVAAA